MINLQQLEQRAVYNFESSLIYSLLFNFLPVYYIQKLCHPKDIQKKKYQIQNACLNILKSIYYISQRK